MDYILNSYFMPKLQMIRLVFMSIFFNNYKAWSNLQILNNTMTMQSILITGIIFSSHSLQINTTLTLLIEKLLNYSMQKFDC